MIPLTRRVFLDLGVAAAVIRAASAAPTLTAERVHQELEAGNRRFASGRPRHPHSSLSWARRLGKLGQRPHAVVLCCSDSRVPPEILFDQGIGDLFVVRVAGNVANEDEIGSIEYAAEHLDVPLCVVLGHTACGAVGAVVAGQKLSKEMEHLVSPIQSAYRKAKALHPELNGQAMIRETVRMNVLEAAAELKHGHGILEERIKAGRLRVEGAIYDLETGRVGWVAI